MPFMRVKGNCFNFPHKWKKDKNNLVYILRDVLSETIYFPIQCHIPSTHDKSKEEDHMRRL